MHHDITAVHQLFRSTGGEFQNLWNPLDIINLVYKTKYKTYLFKSEKFVYENLSDYVALKMHHFNAFCYDY